MRKAWKLLQPSRPQLSDILQICKLHRELVSFLGNVKSGLFHDFFLFNVKSHIKPPKRSSPYCKSAIDWHFSDDQRRQECL